MWLDLSPRGRTIFVALFFAGEAALVATAGSRSDRSYGFRMFPETSTVFVHVSRRLDGGKEVPVVGGRWEAHDCGGKPHAYVWSKMVRFPAPYKLDAELGAPYGVDSGVARTRDALRWIADHVPDDCETRAFVARVQMKRNGVSVGATDVEASRADR
jgi:hypothetical protein